MRSPQNSQAIPIRLDVASTLAGFAEDMVIADGLKQAIKHEIATTATTLGIGGTPEVTIHIDPALPKDRWMRLTINEQPCRYSDDLLMRVYGYAEGTWPKHPDQLSELRNMLRSAAITDRHQASAVEFMSLMCDAIVRNQPAVLLGASQIELCRHELIKLGLPKQWQGSQQLGPILRRLLDLRISIGDRQLIAQTLRETSALAWDDAVEDLIAALRPQAIEIQVEPAYLRQLTCDNELAGPDIIIKLRSWVLAERGIICPPLHFVPAPELKPRGFAFKINHLPTTPIIGLPPDRWLLNYADWDIRSRGVAVEPLSNPLHGYPGCIVTTEAKQLLEAQSIESSNQFDYLAQSLLGVLRRSSHCLLDRQLVDQRLQWLKSLSPALVQAAEENLSVALITRALRMLLANGLPISNLSLILERMLEHRLFVAQQPDLVERREWICYTGYDDLPPITRPIALEIYLRTGMADMISARYTENSDLVLYQIEQQNERVLLSYNWSDAPLPQRSAAALDDLLYRLRRELAKLSPDPQIPPLLIHPNLHPVLQPILALEIPRMSVLAYSDLPPHQVVLSRKQIVF